MRAGHRKKSSHQPVAEGRNRPHASRGGIAWSFRRLTRPCAAPRGVCDLAGDAGLGSVDIVPYRVVTTAGASVRQQPAGTTCTGITSPSCGLKVRSANMTPATGARGGVNRQPVSSSAADRKPLFCSTSCR